MADTTKERTALVLCDLQPDLLGSIKQRDNLLLSLRVPLEAARRNKWEVVYSALQFKSRYEGVSPKHKLYGALCKLNQKLGDKAVHWFMEGWDGSKILSSDPIVSPKETDSIVWRSQHVPYELAKLLKEKDIFKVYIVGAKASGSIQAAVQIVMDNGMDVSVIKECIQDDSEERLNATIDHLLPIYSNVISLKEMMEDTLGLESFSTESKDILVHLFSKGDESNDNNDVLLASDCGRRGHGSRYIQLLKERGGWMTYPTQVWYEDFIHQFHCPLAKKVVDFCDEPEFSKVAMYLSGREFLDEKDKVLEFAGRFMPKTFCINVGQWVGDEPPSDDEDGATDAPWFIKESDKNLGGAAIDIVGKPSEIMARIKKDQAYVVQQHIRDPLLTDDGRKTHLKFYVLLICNHDGLTWTLYTYKGALLSISPNVWSPTDLTHDTQITIHRHPEPPGETEGWKQHWESTYEKCKQGTAEVIERAIKSGKLKGRRGKKQFEVFSVDWMPDSNGNIWMFEFNLSPAVAQREFDDASKRDARRDYLMRHDEIMLREALDIAIPWDGGETPDDSNKSITLAETASSSSSKGWGQRRFGLRAWPPHPDQGAATHWLYDHLGAFHNSKKAMNLSNLVKHFDCEEGIDFLSASTQVLLPFDHAEHLLSIVKTTYLSAEDFWGAKLLVLTAYLIYESKITNVKEIFAIVKECFQTDGEIDEDRLAKQLPFCFEGYKTVESVEKIKDLEQLDLQQLKEEVSEAESTITLVVKDRDTQTEKPFNSLINLNTALKLSIGKNQKTIRLKHDGARIFLSSSGRQTLCQLCMADNDILEIEDSIDTVLQPSSTTRRKKKNKKKESKRNKSH